MPLNAFMQQVNGLNVDREVIAQVITLSDNLTHPYITSIDMSKANSHPIGIAKFHTIREQQVLDYWVKYDGVVVISFNITDLNHENTNSLNFSESHNLNGRIQNNEYNYSFICRVSRVKQQGQEIIILLEDIGWKFMQKVPSEFRQTYIANQYLDDAFQAMCEFLDVHFAYSIEDLHAFQFGADGYSITKDGNVIEEVQTFLANTTSIQPEETDSLDDPLFEDQALFDLLSGNLPPTEEDTTLSETTDDSLTKKIEEHQDDFDKKIIDLFIGNAYYDSDLTHPIMDYGRITVTPSSNTNSTLSNTDSSEIEEVTDSADQPQINSINKQMQDASQQSISLLASFTKKVLSNPKATQTVGKMLFGENPPEGSVAKFLQEAATDKKKQKTLLQGLKSYARNPK